MSGAFILSRVVEQAGGSELGHGEIQKEVSIALSKLLVPVQGPPASPLTGSHDELAFSNESGGDSF